MNFRLAPGSVIWFNIDPTIGREQAGRRPAVVVSSSGYLGAVPDLVIVVPGTTSSRGWPHHVVLGGSNLELPQTTYAMTEQPRTISRSRIFGAAGRVDQACLSAIRRWLDDFLDEPQG